MSAQLPNAAIPASTPSVSVIVPTWNRCQLVQRALTTVLAQTHPPDELIVVDDGSSDSTAEHLRDHPGIRLLIQEQRGGVSAARNRGAAVASGEWLAFLDSDDEWLPEKLEHQLAALMAEAAEPAADPRLEVAYPLVHCDELWIRQGRRVNPRRRHAKRGGWIYTRCLPLCVISPSASLIHRRTFEQLGGFDESFPACEDYDLWLRLCARAPVLYVDRPLVIKHGGHDDQLSRLPALDRHRIRALAKMLESNRLTDHDRQATVAMLHAKIDVYAAGAGKRGRHLEAAELEALRRRWPLVAEG